MTRHFFETPSGVENFFKGLGVAIIISTLFAQKNLIKAFYVLMKNKINLGIILSAFILLIIVNYDYCRCFYLFTNKVCVYIKNESGQNIPSGYLTSYQNDTIKFFNIKNGNDVCLKYKSGSGGENAFTLTVNLSNNSTLQYGPEYSEDGYCFDLIVTSEKIESK